MRNPLRPRPPAAACAVLASLLLAGCGAYGALYLPDNAPKPGPLKKEQRKTDVPAPAAQNAPAPAPESTSPSPASP